MKKKILNFLLEGVCVILLAGCGSETDVQELDGIKIDMQATTEPTKSPMEVPAAEPSDVPATESSEVPAQEATESPDIETTTPEEIVETRMAYQQVLTTVMNDLKLPDGTELYYDSFHAFSQNKFAIHDVDGDGREEINI